MVTAPRHSRPPPHPHQLAYGQDGQLKGFAVLEYETAEMAEEAQQQADGLALGGSHLRTSFCAPGPPGRSMLAALIAAQATVSAQGVGVGDLGGQALLPLEIKVPGLHYPGSGATGRDTGPRLAYLGCEPPSSLLRLSIGAKGSCLNPASCSCSAAWGPPPPSSCCSILCFMAPQEASRVRRVKWTVDGVPSLSEPGNSPGLCSHLSSQ